MRLPTPFIPCDSWSCTLAHLFELPSSSFDPSYNVALMHSTSVSKTIHTTITSTHKKADRIKSYSQSCNGQSPWQLINISSTHNFCSWTIQIKLHYRPRLLLLDIFLCAASVYIFLFHILFLPLPFLFFDCQSSICRKKIRIEFFAIGTMARKRERERRGQSNMGKRKLQDLVLSLDFPLTSPRFRGHQKFRMRIVMENEYAAKSAH